MPIIVTTEGTGSTLTPPTHVDATAVTAPTQEADGEDAPSLPMPEWMKELADVAHSFLSLGQWEVTMSLVPDEEMTKQAEEGGNTDLPEAVSAETLVNARYLWAHITVREGLEDDEDGANTMLHEMVHVQQGPLFMARARILDLVPEALKDHAHALWSDALEQVTTLNVRTLMPYFLAEVRKRRAETHPPGPAAPGSMPIAHYPDEGTVTIDPDCPMLSAALAPAAVLV